ncbi:hypothetical protein BC939DRAFT_445088 [Gamsiella multidivaricata]|uniref:uncharacterized protein n=1 Tax=Gamsiella multidivaricata TaxID=101098 RepID=UPI00221F31FA|nr:uncharacterized protein BC939DRAFT_445088 [Gamsiella multidivaricata]KAI7827397.1 hypothetical protein BC939DRAFT_445088 [Gamsiella multidivaricata]
MVNFSGADIFLFVVGFFLPPLAVGLKQGCGADFLISIGLTLLGHVPGIIYSWYIIYKNRDEPNVSNRYHGRTYVAVPQQPNYQATAPAAGVPRPVN